LLALAGDWDLGLSLVRETLQRNPHNVPQVGFALWADHLRRGEFEKAYMTALVYRDASAFWRELMIASSLGHLGRPKEAQTSIEELSWVNPDIGDRGRTLIGYYVKPAELRESILAGLRKAGLTLR